MTITLSEDAARWARHKAADENTSVSRLLGSILERAMRDSDEFEKAHERWKALKPIKGIDAVHRLPREQAHERR